MNHINANLEIKEKEIAVGTIQSTLIVIMDHDKTADCI